MGPNKWLLCDLNGKVKVFSRWQRSLAKIYWPFCRSRWIVMSNQYSLTDSLSVVNIGLIMFLLKAYGIIIEIEISKNNFAFYWIYSLVSVNSISFRWKDKRVICIELLFKLHCLKKRVFTPLIWFVISINFTFAHDLSRKWFLFPSNI